MNRNRALDNEMEEWAWVQWCNGYSQREIAEALFVNEQTVGRTMRKFQKQGRKKERVKLVYQR